MKIGPGVSKLWRVENRPLPLTWPMAYTTACTTVQVQVVISKFLLESESDILSIKNEHSWNISGTSTTDALILDAV